MCIARAVIDVQEMCSKAQSPSINHDEIDEILRYLWHSQDDARDDGSEDKEGGVASPASASAVEVAAKQRGCDGGGESWYIFMTVL